MKKRLFAILIRVLLLTFTVTLFLFMGEVMIRLSGFVNRLHNRCVNIYYSRIGYMHMPNIHTHFWMEGKKIKYETNNLGFRDRDRKIEKEKGTYRVLVLGDSMVEMPYVPLEKTFPAVLEANLNDKEENIQHFEFINLGRMALGTVCELEVLKSIGLKLQPDCVLLTFYMNDLLNNYYPPLKADGSADQSYLPVIDPYIFHLAKDNNGNFVPVEAKKYPHRSSFRQFINKHLYLYQFLGDSFPRLRQLVRSISEPEEGDLQERSGAGNKLAGKKTDRPELIYPALFLTEEPKEITESWEVTEYAIRKMQALLDARGIPLVVLYIPASFETGLDIWEDKMRSSGFQLEDCKFRLVDSKLKAICDKYGIEFISLNDHGCERNHYFLTDPHLNEHGQKFAGDVLASYFESLDLSGAKTETSVAQKYT